LYIIIDISIFSFVKGYANLEYNRSFFEFCAHLIILFFYLLLINNQLLHHTCI